MVQFACEIQRAFDLPIRDPLWRRPGQKALKTPAGAVGGGQPAGFVKFPPSDQILLHPGAANGECRDRFVGVVGGNRNGGGFRADRLRTEANLKIDAAGARHGGGGLRDYGE